MIRGPVIDWARMDHTFSSLTNDLQKFVSLIIIMQSSVSPIALGTAGSQLGLGAGILPSMSPSSAVDKPGF